MRGVSYGTPAQGRAPPARLAGAGLQLPRRPSYMSGGGRTSMEPGRSRGTPGCAAGLPDGECVRPVLRGAAPLARGRRERLPAGEPVPGPLGAPMSPEAIRGCWSGSACGPGWARLTRDGRRGRSVTPVIVVAWITRPASAVRTDAVSARTLRIAPCGSWSHRAREAGLPQNSPRSAGQLGRRAQSWRVKLPSEVRP